MKLTILIVCMTHFVEACTRLVEQLHVLFL